MNRDFYLRLHSRMNNDSAKRILSVLDKLSSGFIFFSYPLVLIYLWYTGYGHILRLVLTTLISFIGVSVFRKVYNKKRPYEVFELEPVLKKDDAGESFPSRHVFSAFVIAFSTWTALPAYSCAVLLAGLVIMVVRVLGTVHFISDVTAGALIGITCSLPMLFS